MSDKNKLDELVSTGIDWDKRRIYFGSIDSGEDGGEFSWHTVERAIRAIHKMSEININPIEIHMNSEGGNPYDMLRLVDEIEAAPVQIKFIGGGMIASCATWVMAVCDHRYLHKNTTVLVHDGNDGISGTHTDGQIQAQHLKKMQDRLYDIYESNSRMPKSFWQDLCQRDLYLKAEEAVLLGLADEIIDSRKRGNVRKSRTKRLNGQPNAKEMQDLIKDLYKRIERSRVPKLAMNESKEEFDDSLTNPFEAQDNQ